MTVIHIAVMLCGCGFMASALDRDRAAAMMLDHMTFAHKESQ